jgi:hypothetical protein
LALDLCRPDEEAFPGYQAPISAEGMGKYIYDFTLTGNAYFNGKVLQVSSIKQLP